MRRIPRGWCSLFALLLGLGQASMPVLAHAEEPGGPPSDQSAQLGVGHEDAMPPGGSVVAVSPLGSPPPPVPTVADFDTPGTPYVLTAAVDPPTLPPTVTSGGGQGSFLRLATQAPPYQNNTIAFDRTAPGAMCRMTADFDIRMTPFPPGRADGMGVAFLATGTYGKTGGQRPEDPLYVTEEPNFARSVGVGFDIHQRTGDPVEPDNNHVSVHFDRVVLAQVPVGAFDLAGGQWIHVRVVVASGDVAPTVSVVLDQGALSATPISNLAVPGLEPYESRALFGGRSGGLSANHDLDNVNVTYQSCPSAVGAWSDVMAWPSVAIHASLLPNGKVLFWDRNDYPGNTGRPRTWDPITGEIRTAADPGYDVFCAGHTFLPDGRLLAVGGHMADGEGLRNASLYDPSADTWARQPDMNAGRWYPTATETASGDVLAVSGSYWDGTLNPNGTHHTVSNDLPQVYSSSSAPWRSLTGAVRQQPLYPFMYAAPNGRAFDAGPQQMAHYLNTTGTGQWTDVAPSSRTFRDYGSSAMYADGKVLITGGSEFDAQGMRNAPTRSAEIIDLNVPSPQWNAVGDMHFGRRQHDATLLPDGRVLVTGGTAAPGFNDARGAVLAGEIWDPATGRWSSTAAMQVPRLYHSTALLLPDARVLVAGGGHPSDVANGDGDHFDAEVYSPPYLFKGPRPTITSAPAAVGYGQTFVVGTPNAASVAGVTLVRLGSVTHGFDESQRIERLSFTASAGAVNVSAPANGNLGPPGDYMLFLLDGNGVPSVARIVRLSPTIPSTYRPLTPARILDTREPGSGGAIGPGQTTDVQVTGLGGVPSTGVGAVVMNVTVTQPTATSFLTLFPAGSVRPPTANLNWTPGKTVPNLVVVKVGAGGRVSMFNNAGSTHVIFDVAGWFGDAPGGNSGRYQPLTPSRLLDTRDGTGAPAMRLGPGASLELQVAGRGGVPASGAEGAVLNVAVTNVTATSFLTIHPTGEARPWTANVNFNAGDTVSNRAMVKLGTGGKVTIYNHAGSADVIVDVGGWFTDSTQVGSSGRYAPLVPDRILDTRNGTGGITGPIAAGTSVEVGIAGRGGVPYAGVSAVIFNVTVTQPVGPGWLTIYPSDAPPPLASDLNYAAAETRPNLVVVRVGPDGKVRLFTSAQAHVIVDVAGFVT